MTIEVVRKPKQTVKSKEVEVEEFIGCGSDGTAEVSVARVTSKGKWARDWQISDFDELVYVLRGRIQIEHSGGTDEVCAGQLARVTKGERVRWVFPDAEGAEYIPICLPSFSPDKVACEVGTGEPLTETTHTEYPQLFHLVQKELWEKAKAEGAVYYPPTYAKDGFTHATANPQFLLGVANHFYKNTGKEWLCLEMTVDTLKAAGVLTKFEAPAPVGSTPAIDAKDFGGELFPHVYGGIPTVPEVVLKEYPVQRDEQGTFLGISGLTD
uniref:Cupin domain-containing protein n=1 Tax=Tetraselmis sp. GSL018 TaxID=582737 RepID=A0A061QZU6_9CHLO|mmetsp:Transcript_31082/g.73889  ORF Transcript_31082/g.73889 Transcript_31082/m.73889 type:complete len:268 (+) Transcript_31082:61-864(+)|eukprot:CAMPEP_0177609714 /NCGR_PEP_ID=MMETSP0419_2-20121207/19284_1 /TAXON_ID=582737 /ORGANISM="Tetraselmis sp., Strain GSL018" /LENGTH=267 /DNA_ID=CAMNT_0019104753 /DNA_START=39 /DNA_END=842 /DNA_ORIENTATION=+